MLCIDVQKEGVKPSPVQASWLLCYAALYKNRYGIGNYAMVDSLKYYLYVSDKKVDMLYQQVPKRMLQKIASELSINLKLVAAEVGATIKSASSEETRYSKLKIVAKYIEEHENVGTIDE